VGKLRGAASHARARATGRFRTVTASLCECPLFPEFASPIAFNRAALRYHCRALAL